DPVTRSRGSDERVAQRRGRCVPVRVLSRLRVHRTDPKPSKKIRWWRFDIPSGGDLDVKTTELASIPGNDHPEHWTGILLHATARVSTAFNPLSGPPRRPVEQRLLLDTDGQGDRSNSGARSVRPTGDQSDS